MLICCWKPFPSHIAPSLPQNLIVKGVVGELALKTSWDAPSHSEGRPVMSYTVQIREVVENKTATDFTSLTPLPVLDASQVHFTYNIRDSHNFHLSKNTVYEWALLNVCIVFCIFIILPTAILSSMPYLSKNNQSLGSNNRIWTHDPPAFEVSTLPNEPLKPHSWLCSIPEFIWLSKLNLDEYGTKSGVENAQP